MDESAQARGKKDTRLVHAVLEFLNNLCGLYEPSRHRVVVPARQATQPGGIGSLESILGLLNSLKVRDLYLARSVQAIHVQEYMYFFILSLHFLLLGSAKFLLLTIVVCSYLPGLLCACNNTRLIR